MYSCYPGNFRKCLLCEENSEILRGNSLLSGNTRKKCVNCCPYNVGMCLLYEKNLERERANVIL